MEESGGAVRWSERGFDGPGESAEKKLSTDKKRYWGVSESRRFDKHQTKPQVSLSNKIWSIPVGHQNSDNLKFSRLEVFSQAMHSSHRVPKDPSTWQQTATSSICPCWFWIVSVFLLKTSREFVRLPLHLDTICTKVLSLTLPIMAILTAGVLFLCWWTI